MVRVAATARLRIDSHGRSPLWGFCASFLIFLLVTSVGAHTTVTEDFTNLGQGVLDTRFDLAMDNFVERTDLVINVGTGGPNPGEMRDQGFGPEVFAPGATINGGTFSGGTVKTNQFGLATTNNIFTADPNLGSDGGEFGGMFNWLNYGFYADTDVGLTFGQHGGGNGGSASDPLKIQATVMIKNLCCGADENASIGYFTDDPNLTGQADDMRTRSGVLSPASTMKAGVSFLPNGRFYLWINRSERLSVDAGWASVPTDTPFTIDLDVYVDEPQGQQPLGVIEGTINGVSVRHERDTNGTEDLGHFGIGSTWLRPLQDEWRRTVAYFDDVTYSVDTDVGFDADPNRFPMAAPPADNADFDDNDLVNGRDHLIWQRNLGLTGQTDNSNGDANGDGVVDDEDLPIWRTQYGQAPPSVASASGLVAVPEPQSAVMMLLACFLGAGLRLNHQ